MGDEKQKKIPDKEIVITNVIAIPKSPHPKENIFVKFIRILKKVNPIFAIVGTISGGLTAQHIIPEWYSTVIGAFIGFIVSVYTTEEIRKRL